MFWDCCILRVLKSKMTSLESFLMVLCSGLLGVQTEKLILTGGHYGLVEGTSIINGPKGNKGPITSIGGTNTSAI